MRRSRSAFPFSHHLLVPLAMLLALAPAMGALARPAGVRAVQPHHAGTIDFSNVTAYLQSQISSSLPGLSLIIAAPNSVLYEQPFGDYTLGTVAPYRSSSKMLVAAAVMTLVDQGKIALDTPVTAYLPPSIWPGHLNDGKANITMRELLSHTAGFINGIHNSRLACWSNKNIPLDRCVQEIVNIPLEAQPGTAFAYGDWDYQVAGAVVEHVLGQTWAPGSGSSWDQFFQSAIALPCGITSITWGHVPNPWIAGDGSGNLGDYAKVLHMTLNGGACGAAQVLSSSSVQQMQQDETNGLIINFSPFPPTWHYGFGWWLDANASGGATVEYSDLGGSGTIPWLRKDLQYGAFVLMDQPSTQETSSIWTTIDPMINNDIINAPPPARHAKS